MDLQQQSRFIAARHPAKLAPSPLHNSATTNVMQQQQVPASQQSHRKRTPTQYTPLPIDDFDLLDNPSKYSEEERQLRIKLAAVYRLIDLNGWSMGIYNHVTAKLEKQNERILMHPFGLHYDEITASSLLKLDMHGNIVDQGSTNFEMNRPGYIFHSAVHLARPDLKAVIHLHFAPVTAASACKYGLLPICQEQALLGEIAYLDYTGIPTQEAEREAVAEGLGQKCKVMILRNHGLIVCGESVEEALYLLTNLMRACEAQARILALGGLESLVMMSEESAEQAYTTVQNSRYPIRQILDRSDDERSDESTTSGNESDLDQSPPGANSHPRHLAQKNLISRKAVRRDIIGYINMFEMDFEAQMRSLDAAGHQTGYKYKRPLVRSYRKGVSLESL